MIHKAKTATWLVLLALASGMQACEGGGDNGAGGTDFIHDLFLIDMHVDTLMAMRYLGYDISQRHAAPVGFQPWIPYLDIPRMQEGGMDAAIFGIVTMPFCTSDCPGQVQKYLDVMDAAAARNADTIGLARSPEDIERLRAEGKISIVLDIEGAQALDGEVARAAEFYERGVRVLTLAHFWSNPFAPAESEKAPDPPGLTEKGRALVREMNRLGMIVDVSHAHPSAVQEAASLSTRPIVYSHIDAYGLCHLDRNARDEDLEAVAATGGLAGVMFYPIDAACSPKAGWEVILDQVDYMVGKIGVDHVGIGSDMDGFVTTPAGFEDVTDYPMIIEGLLARGYSQGDVRKIMGENFLRVFREVSATD